MLVLLKIWHIIRQLVENGSVIVILNHIGVRRRVGFSKSSRLTVLYFLILCE